MSFLPSIQIFKKKIVSKATCKDGNNYLLAMSKFGTHMQEEIDLYITRNRLNEASFRHKLDPIEKKGNM